MMIIKSGPTIRIELAMQSRDTIMVRNATSSGPAIVRIDLIVQIVSISRPATEIVRTVCMREPEGRQISPTIGSNRVATGAGLTKKEITIQSEVTTRSGAIKREVVTQSEAVTQGESIRAIQSGLTIERNLTTEKGHTRSRMIGRSSDPIHLTGQAIVLRMRIVDQTKRTRPDQRVW